jgi:hypothetical protein
VLGNYLLTPGEREVRAHDKTLQRALCLTAPGQKTGAWRNPHTKSAVDLRWSRAKTVKAREGA